MQSLRRTAACRPPLVLFKSHELVDARLVERRLALELITPVVPVLDLDPASVARPLAALDAFGDDPLKLSFTDGLEQCFAVLERFGGSPVTTVEVDRFESPAALDVRLRH